MTSLLQNFIEYTDSDHLDTLNNIAVKNLVAMRDSISNLGQTIYLGSTKDVTIEAQENITINLGSSNQLSVNDSSNVKSFQVTTNATTTTITGGLKNLVLETSDNSNLTVTVDGLAISQSNNYQVLSSDKDIYLEDSLKTSSNLIVKNNIAVGDRVMCNGSAFTQNMNLFKSLNVLQPSDPKHVGYSFRINSNLQLELLKHATFSNGNQVTRIISTFGINMLSNDDVSNIVNYNAYQTYESIKSLANNTPTDTSYNFPVTNVINTFGDDDVLKVNIPFSFYINGTNYAKSGISDGNIHITSNLLITAQNEYGNFDGFSTSDPDVPTIFANSGDYCWTSVDTYTDGSSIYYIRINGNSVNDESGDPFTIEYVFRSNNTLEINYKNVPMEGFTGISDGQGNWIHDPWTPVNGGKYTFNFKTLFVSFNGASVPTTSDIGNYTLTQQGSSSIVTDPEWGNVVSFNGSSFAVNNYTLAPSYTKMAWIYVTESTQQYQHIISSTTMQGANHYFYVYNGHIGSGHDGNGVFDNRTDTTNSIPLNTWVHVCVTYDNTTNVMKMYHNNVQKYSETFNSQNAWNGGGVVSIGSFNGSSHFSGKISDVRVFSKALTEEQISWMYVLGKKKIDIESGLICRKFTVDNPVSITTAEQMNSVFHQLNAWFEVIADLGITKSTNFVVPQLGTPYGFEYTGYLNIQTSGVYAFNIASSTADASDLAIYINNAWSIISHAYQSSSVSGNVTLTGSTLYPIRIRYQNNFGVDGVNVTWMTPGSSQYEPLPFSALYCNSATSPTTFTLRECFPDPIKGTLYGTIPSLPVATDTYTSLSTEARSACIGIYDLKVMRAAYVGPIVKVRHPWYFTEQDFYIDGQGNLNTLADGTGTEYSAWLGGADGHVMTWYDQSGNDFHLTQASQNRQPKLTIEKRIIFDGLDDCLELAYSSAYNPAQFSYFVGCNTTTFSGFTQFKSLVSTMSSFANSGFTLYRTDDSSIMHYSSTYTNGYDTGVDTQANSRYNIAVKQYSTNAITSIVNGTTQSGYTSYAQNTTASFTMGAITLTTTKDHFWDGAITEFYYFNIPLSTEDTNKLIDRITP